MIPSIYSILVDADNIKRRYAAPTAVERVSVSLVTEGQYMMGKMNSRCG